MNSPKNSSETLESREVDSRVKADADLLDYSNKGSEKDVDSKGRVVKELRKETYKRKFARWSAAAVILVFLSIIVMSFFPALNPWIVIPAEVAAACANGVVFLMIVLLIPAEKLVELIKP